MNSAPHTSPCRPRNKHVPASDGRMDERRSPADRMETERRSPADRMETDRRDDRLLRPDRDDPERIRVLSRRSGRIHVPPERSRARKSEYTSHRDGPGQIHVPPTGTVWDEYTSYRDGPGRIHVLSGRSGTNTRPTGTVRDEYTSYRDGPGRIHVLPGRSGTNICSIGTVRGGTESVRIPQRGREAAEVQRHCQRPERSRPARDESERLADYHGPLMMAAFGSR